MTKRLLALAAFLCCFLPSCGAQDKDGPLPKAQPQKCQSLEEIAPALMDALKGGQSEKLRAIVEREHLFDEQSDGSPSPIKTILRTSLSTLSSMAGDGAEPGAAEGQLCNNEAPPPASESNRMCEARRILDLFVHNGQANDLLDLWDPLIARVTGYIVGASLEPAHYEPIGVFAASCTKAYCRTEDLLDVGIGLIAFLEPTETEPRRLIDVLSLLHQILADPGMSELVDSAQSNMGEDALVAFGNILFDNVMAFPTDPEQFAVKYHRDLEVKLNDLFTSTLKITREDPKSASLRLLLDQLIGPHELADLDSPHGASRPLLMDLLDPNRAQPVLPALQAELNCLRKNDPNSSLLRLVFNLSFEGDALGLDELLGVLVDLAELDERVSVLTFLKRTLVMIRADEEATNAIRRLCARGLDTTPASDGGTSNAELVMPVVSELFSGGATAELVCVLDSLLYGCASGSQPACAP